LGSSLLVRQSDCYHSPLNVHSSHLNRLIACTPGFADHRTENLTRTPKASAFWMKGVVEQNGFVSNSSYTPPSKSDYPWNAYPARPPPTPKPQNPKTP
jgi:hypothetical protein